MQIISTLEYRISQMLHLVSSYTYLTLAVQLSKNYLVGSSTGFIQDLLYLSKYFRIC